MMEEGQGVTFPLSHFQTLGVTFSLSLDSAFSKKRFFLIRF
jgi:hypothetical protein